MTVKNNIRIKPIKEIKKFDKFKRENFCRFCGKELGKDKIPVRAYWYRNYRLTKEEQDNRLFYSHKNCLENGKNEEAYLCQCIDADCNDCKYFTGTGFIGKEIRIGHCDKLHKEVKAYPNFCSGHECFIHRLD